MVFPWFSYDFLIFHHFPMAFPMVFGCLPEATSPDVPKLGRLVAKLAQLAEVDTGLLGASVSESPWGV